MGSVIYSFENKFHQSFTQTKNISVNLQRSVPTVRQQEQEHPSFQQPINIIQQNTLRLPTIELPKFDGSWEKWLPFRDTFSSMVHSNNSLPEIDKLHYLRWALVGDAYKLVESLEVINKNYLIDGRSSINDTVTTRQSFSITFKH